jgi:hypothetical protein
MSSFLNSMMKFGRQQGLQNSERYVTNTLTAHPTPAQPGLIDHIVEMGLGAELQRKEKAREIRIR